MELGNFQKPVESDEIRKMASDITGESVKAVSRICEQWGEAEDEVREYDVYVIETDAGKYTLKKTGSKEAQIYAQYLSKGEFHVPQYVGMRQAEDADWICMKYVEGNDMRDMTDETTEKAAETLSKIQSYFWTLSMDKAPENEVEQRFVEYWKRVLRRASSVADDPILRKAYQMFLDRQLTCPCTMSNGDFLQWNVIYDGENVVMIDWGFGGMMPYSLDIARFLAHATETRSTFPFYMNDAQKELFLDRMYEALKTKISREQFNLDVKLATLNEYIEFVESEEDEDGWYLEHAQALAEELLNL